MLVALLCGVGRRCLASENSDFSLHLVRFGLYFTSYYQPEDSYSRSAMLLYSPSLRFDDKISLITDLGATYLHTPDSQFWALFFSERFDYRFTKSLSADLNAGVQHWTKEAGISPMAGLGFSYHLDSSVIPFIDSVRVAGERVWEKDYKTWQFLIGVEIDLDGQRKEPAPKPSESPFPLQPSPVPEFKVTLTAENLSFASGKSILSPAGKDYVESVAKVFVQHNSVWTEISITGHTDNAGSPQKNIKLSMDRANAVAFLFKQQGIDPAKLKVTGVGPSHPIAPNDTDEGKRKNRRVELGVVADPRGTKELSQEIDEINKARQSGGHE